jgi:hypothetical protein
MQSIKQKIDQLPPEYQQEVNDFIDFLLEKRLKVKAKKPAFTWAGALKEYKDKYTSVELQHKISKLRAEIK